MQGVVAVLGGTFDPIHLGHLQIATEIIKQKAADSVLFVPSGHHHFKKNTIILPYAKRYSLVEKAIKNNPKFDISDADKEGSGYTADLMKKLFCLYPQVNFSFVIGSDNLPQLNKWYDYAYLAENLHFLIFPRPGYPLLPQVINQIKATILDISPCPVSATEIRQRISNGESIKGMVPEELEEEIVYLYQNKDNTKAKNPN